MARDVTVRDGTSEKYWYTIAAYLAVAIIAILYSANTILSEGQPSVQAVALAVPLLAVTFGGLIIYPALFKDSAYIRDTRKTWNPKWWYYILFGLGIPAGLYAFTSGIGASAAFPTAVLSHALTAPITAAYYLYQRHKFLGVP